MEYIDAKSTSPTDAPEKVADALQWLYCLPAPPDVVIGPLGGGLARHMLFRDDEAPFLFSSKEAVQRYMNTALEGIPPASRPKEIDFSNECIVFTQSGMHERNFLIDTNDKMCMVNFEDVGLLPQSFAIFTMRNSDDFAKEVGSYLDWSPTPNLYSMTRAYAILQTSADCTLGTSISTCRRILLMAIGLDEHGMPIDSSVYRVPLHSNASI
jgi:hypothetical protein